jgi:hypothetical protein
MTEQEGGMSALSPTSPRWLGIAALNRRLHWQALNVFLFIVLAHWVEHLAQAYQVWALDWPRSAARGALGQLFPWLATSEWLHYWYALVMIIGLVLLQPGFGRPWRIGGLE